MNRLAITRARTVGWGGVIVAVLAILLLNSVFVLDQRKQAIVLRLGEPLRVINPPGADQAGLHWKAPFIDRLVEMDRRNQPIEADQVEVDTADETQLTMDAYLGYRIADPLSFYRALHDPRTAADRLGQVLSSSLREVLGQASLHDIVSGPQDALMRRVAQDAADKAKAARLGVEVIGAGLRRTALPLAAQQTVYRRMQASYADRAAQVRASGEQQKRQIMAEADQQVAEISANATAEVLRIRGEGEAKRAAIFNAAYGRDPEFAAFFRALQAYDTGLARPNTTFVMSPNSAFFNVLKAGPGGK